jgi:hypothetical protein
MNETEVIITVHNLLFYEVLLLYPVTDVVTLFTYTPMPFCGHCGSSVTADLQCVECLSTVVSGGDIFNVLAVTAIISFVSYAGLNAAIEEA